MIKLQLNKYPKWILDFQSHDFQVPEQKEITKLFGHLNNMIQNDPIEDIDDILKNIQNVNINLELKANILRFTYPMRHKLKNWNQALNKVDEKLKEYNLESRNYLIGLKS